MKRHCVHKEGEYQVWSGKENFKTPGLYIVMWRGWELVRTKYLTQAYSEIDRHKRQQVFKPAVVVKSITPETEDFLDKLFK